MTASANLKISKAYLDFIRSLEDFDLIMLLSEIHDFGWTDLHGRKGPGGKDLLPMMRDAIKTRAKRENQWTA